ncbi:DUF3667 domain-containing protein [Rhodanobacter sp. 7MK24]|uniref:DUF3667 domain-containing protein n=1 Tax=Rhodanobacter sp. 7MK24 TaxID=2775922 RepID=UPI0017824F78|nr:DUF3667 domain-containing protein [Rhodanobacter sp. 7MK24]
MELSGACAAVCANCGAPLGGEYCAQCGERRMHPDEHTLRHVVGEWFEAFSHGEGRLLKSLRTLLFQPGELTREYFRGRRVPYTRPVALFFAVNLLYFLLAVLQTFNTSLSTQLEMAPLTEVKQAMIMRRVAGASISGTESAAFAGDYWRTENPSAMNAGKSTEPTTATSARAVVSAHDANVLGALQSYGKRYDERTDALSRALVIALVPMLACWLWLALVPWRRGLAELSIFATHAWAALLLILLVFGWAWKGLANAMLWFRGELPAFLQTDGYGSATLGLLVLAYLYCALRNNFRFSWVGSAALCVWTMAGLYLSLELYRVLLFFVTVYALH